MICNVAKSPKSVENALNVLPAHHHLPHHGVVGVQLKRVYSHPVIIQTPLRIWTERERFSFRSFLSVLPRATEFITHKSIWFSYTSSSQRMWRASAVIGAVRADHRGARGEKGRARAVRKARAARLRARARAALVRDGAGSDVTRPHRVRAHERSFKVTMKSYWRQYLIFFFLNKFFYGILQCLL